MSDSEISRAIKSRIKGKVSIMGIGTGYGVGAIGVNNITVKNCIIRDFQDAVEVNSTTNGVFLNDTLRNNTQYGAFIDPLSSLNSFNDTFACYNPFDINDTDTTLFHNTTCDNATISCTSACPIPPVIITNCTNVTGTMVLGASIVTSGSCMNMTNNSILDCAGFTISGPGFGYGVNATGVTNVTVKNCIIKNFNDAIEVDSTTDSRFLNDSLLNNTVYGASLPCC